MVLNFNQDPYYDDYDQTKGFLKVLFRPGYAVQARELTQMQDILQNQVGNFGKFVFQSGSPVLGGQITLDTNVTYANVNPLYQNTSVQISQFANTVITDVATKTVRASVIGVVPQLSGSTNPPTLMLKYLTGTTFPNGANITVEGAASGPFALLANTNSQGTGSVASIQDGIFFLDLNNLNPVANTLANSVASLTNAYFVRVPKQTIVLDTYDNTPTYKVGLQISDTIITEQLDTSLLDPALEATNYQAPGAARYVINATLSTRGLQSQDDTAFITLLTVSNGQLQAITSQPQLAQLNTILAKRTYDQSGSFTVKPFVIKTLDTANNDLANANSQQYYTSISPGLAYVEGFQYQTVSKTFLSAPRARTIANVSSATIQTYFGNFFYVDTVNGEFNFTTLPLVDIHCVNWANVNTVTTQAYSNTKIGTARVRSFEYNSATNTSNPQLYVFRAGLFSINTSSITGNTVSSTGTTITFASLFNASDNAYMGMYINIPSTGDTRLITSYNGANRIATVDHAWSSNPAGSSAFSLLGNINSAESFGLNAAANFATANCNINIGSKNQANAYQYASLGDSNFNTLIYRFPNYVIAQGLQSPSYQYRTRIATGQTLGPGSPLVVNLSISGDSSAQFTTETDAGSDLLTLSDFLVVTSGTGGQIIPMVSALGRSIATTPTTATLTMHSGDPTYTGNVDIYASINTTIGPKTKALILANNQAQSSGTSVGPATLWTSAGQILFATPSTSNLTTPGLAQPMYVADVIGITAIIDTGSLATAPTSAMIQAALNGTAMPGSSVVVTKNYSFFNGQNDNFYDHATISLVPGAPVAKGQLLVLFSYYQPSSTGGYFSVDSYPYYANVSTYNSSGATIFNLRDCLDFRPVRDAATTATTFNNAGTIFLPEPTPTSGFGVSYGYYLPRIDILTLDSSGNFHIIQGNSSTTPQTPPTPAHSMLLYTLGIPAYTFYAANVNITMQNNKRYTMRDIYNLEKRIQNLEYYNSLNAVEQQAINQTNPDSNGNDRPQNGLLVDSFVGSSIADVLNPDYFASIDQKNQILRPPFSSNNFPMVFSPALSSGYAQNGRIITLPYTPVNFISQNAASRSENLNPFNLTVWNGTLKLAPESDTWMDTAQAPSVTTNISGDNDSLVAHPIPFATVWNDWQTVWTGVSTQVTTQVSGGQAVAGHPISSTPDNPFAAQAVQTTVTTTTTTTSQQQVQTGTQYLLSAEQVTVPLGNKLINVSVIPYIRNNNLIFNAFSMKPYTVVYPFFDNVNVNNYVDPHRLVTFTAPVKFQDQYGAWETIVDQDGGTNGGLGPNSAVVFISSGSNQAWIGTEKGVIAPGKTFKGSVSGATATVASYSHIAGQTYEPVGEHYRGLPFQAGVTAIANSTSLVLQAAASNVDGYYVGNTITAWSFTGSFLAVQSTITAYNGASRIATVSPAWNLNVAAGTNISYRLGNITTDQDGSCSGMFSIPAPAATGIQFPTGTGTFMLLDDVNGNLGTASTKAQDSYSAQGTLETFAQEYVTTTVPVVLTQQVSQSQVVTDTQTNQAVSTNVLGWYDPLAQSFYVDNNVYPNGVFITSIRVCFSKVDNNLPVTLQIRPTVNGYPSASTVVPFSQVIMSASQVKATTTPNLDDPTSYTEFVFDAPLCLKAGYEYCFVLISNSNNYEIFSAAVGDKYLGSTRLVSAPPYMGVLFKSQNSSTWTAAQGEALMFRIQRAVFNTSQPLQATFYNPTYSANNYYTRPILNSEIYMDVIYVTNQDQQVPQTTLAYAFRGTANTSRSLDSGYTTFIPATNYYLSQRYVGLPAGNSFYIQVSGTSNTADISPIVDTERYSVIGIGNIINNGGIGNNSITILNGGLGYNVSNTNIVTVTGGGGSGAQLSVASVNANGAITSIIVNPSGGGSGYSFTPNGAITTSGYSPTSNATFAIAGESGSSGGNIVSRYMTRMATLATGQDAGDINVYLDVNIPQNTNIYVYYKIMARADTDTFTNKPWVPMQLVGTQQNATNPSTYVENRYVAALDTYGNPINKVSYGNYNTFAYFAVKVDMVTSNPTVVPTAQNLRIYALPAG